MIVYTTKQFIKKNLILFIHNEKSYPYSCKIKIVQELLYDPFKILRYFPVNLLKILTRSSKILHLVVLNRNILPPLL